MLNSGLRLHIVEIIRSGADDYIPIGFSTIDLAEQWNRD